VGFGEPRARCRIHPHVRAGGRISLAIVLVVPFAGPPLYFAFGRSTIPAQLRLMLTAGGVAAYLVFLTLGLVFGG
jgi:hypothetical protein